jgi:uncharacterized ferritin-like protein (DUF455 family)
LDKALRACIACSDVQEKVRLTQSLAKAWQQGELAFTHSDAPIILGRPEKPELVMPRDLNKRGLGHENGRAAMIHALAHIEFNAINLALDAACRFPDMPRAYYDDWIKVASEEAYHFSLVQTHLQSLGYEYGDFSAHNGLWVTVEETTYDVLARMALVPRVLEARGLDVTPNLLKKFESLGDPRMAQILQIILDDEVGHVAIGNHWYHYLCVERGLNPLDTFIELVKKHFVGDLKGPFNMLNRAKAGFKVEELDWLNTLNKG